MDYDPYLRLDRFPHIWCPGCGDGIVLKAILRAVDRIGLKQDEVCMVSGIGCSSRTSGYVDFNTLHTTHGRALTFATGVKMARPELTVIVATGDGDATAIGGNHFIHAARRNIDMTVILYNNWIYGMTGGQGSPATPAGKRTTTAQIGSIENSFDISALAAAAGASFVARETVARPLLLDKIIERAIRKRGFSLVEVMTPCPTTFGKLNKAGDGAQMTQFLKEHSISASKAATLCAEELKDQVVTGVFVDIDKPEYSQEYARLVERLGGPARPSVRETGSST
ncbi:MAG: 2-oxoacid:ferredoxin oxidoreductase subunit beta [Vicinamibacteria bacterium]|jgi:2-oxoglutarate ferredoxin oxidoreductase subunit beta|nr:2-oxoacid:ferredoxin oxidoreductase subunit beta [Vicinamibacteria bacterium]